MTKKYFITIILIFFFKSSFSQNFKDIFFNMDCRDRVWIITKPSMAIKAKKIAKQVIIFSNNNSNDKYFKLNNSEQNQEEQYQDMFRHIFLMYKLSCKIGIEKSRRIGNIYEKYNKNIFYKKSNSGYDMAGEMMDKFNNEIGLYLFMKLGKVDDEKIIQEIGYQIKEGNARKINKDSKNRSLTIDNKIINDSIWMKNWENERVLIQSNE